MAKLPEGFKPPLAMLQRMAQINDDLLIGNVSLGTDSGIRFNSSFWLPTADKQILVHYLLVTHYTRLHLRKELLPYIKE